MSTIFQKLNKFFHTEAAGGIVLFLAAIAALLIANSSLFPLYDHFLHDVRFRIGFTDTHDSFDTQIEKPLLLWINDGMMVVFFFLVGMEIKREVLEGELASREKALLPALAAIGGMAVPALIFAFFNHDNPDMIRGWAIPAATDIAFALGVLALVGSRAPVVLKVLMAAIAILDDLGAIVIIALFYSDTLVMTPLLFAFAALGGLFLLNRRNVTRIAPYMLLGLILWVAVLQSGIHATLAGVVVAMFIPLRSRADPSYSPLRHLVHNLHPWVTFGVLPMFGFANAGVPLGDLGWNDLLHPVTLGIILGLFVGKQIGVFVIIWLCIISGLTPKPKGTTWIQLYAVSLLCGIGFTMSLFIGGLAYPGTDLQANVRLGVMVGSLISAIMAFLLLRYGTRKKDETA